MFRSHNLGELNLSDVNKDVTLCGWVHKTRDLGGMTFVDLRDRYGVTQLAFNIEYRFRLIGKLDSAIFTDFGNIWNVFDDTNDKKRTFDGLKDLDEIAIGSGFGFRYNLGYFVIRLDMGLKTYNPALDKDKRWFTDFKLKKQCLILD